MHISDVYGGTWSVLLGLPVQSCFHLARNFFVNGRNSFQVEDWWLSMVDMCRFSHPTESMSLCTHIVSNNLLDVFLHKSFLCEGSDGPIREYDVLVTTDHDSQLFLSFSFVVSPISSYLLIPSLSLFFGYSLFQTRSYNLLLVTWSPKKLYRLHWQKWKEFTIATKI